MREPTVREAAACAMGSAITGGIAAFSTNRPLWVMGLCGIILIYSTWYWVTGRTPWGDIDED